MLGAEQRLRAVDRELLDLVDPLAPAVVAPPGVALGVLVREHRADRLEHRRPGEVLGRDQLELVALARELAVDEAGDIGVCLRQADRAELVERLLGGRHPPMLNDARPSRPKHHGLGPRDVDHRGGDARGADRRPRRRPPPPEAPRVHRRACPAPAPRGGWRSSSQARRRHRRARRRRAPARGRARRSDRASPRTGGRTMPPGFGTISVTGPGSSSARVGDARPERRRERRDRPEHDRRRLLGGPLLHLVEAGARIGQAGCAPDPVDGVGREDRKRRRRAAAARGSLTAPAPTRSARCRRGRGRARLRRGRRPPSAATPRRPGRLRPRGRARRRARARPGAAETSRSITSRPLSPATVAPRGSQSRTSGSSASISRRRHVRRVRDDQVEPAAAQPVQEVGLDPLDVDAEARAVPARDLERVVRDVASAHGGAGDLRRQRERDRPRAGADVDERRARRAVEQPDGSDRRRAPSRAAGRARAGRRRRPGRGTPTGRGCTPPARASPAARSAPGRPRARRRRAAARSPCRARPGRGRAHGR